MRILARIQKLHQVMVAVWFCSSVAIYFFSSCGGHGADQNWLLFVRLWDVVSIARWSYWIEAEQVTKLPVQLPGD